MKNSPTTRSSKKGLTVGLTAGLIGGTAAGMVFGVPGLSGAASDTVEPAAIVQQTDEPDAPADVPADDVARDPGARLRETLQDLVDDGTINAQQADAVTEHLVANRPDRGDRPGRRGPGGRHGGQVAEAVTELLGIEADALREQLRAGSTLAEVAEANGVDTQTLIDTLVDDAEARIAAAVEAGKIDTTRAEDLTAQIEERVTDLVNGERPDRGRRGPGAPTDVAD